MFPDSRRHPRNLLLFAALCLLPVPLHAAQLAVTPSLSLQEQYNDNIYAATSARRGDYLSTVSPALAVTDSTENASASLAGGVNGLLYLRNSGSDGLGYFLRGSGSYAWNPRLALSADAGVVRDISASSIDPATSLVTRSRILHQNYRLGENYRVSELLGSSLSLGYGREDYDSTAYLSTEHYLGSAGLDYDLGRCWPGTKVTQTLSFSRDATNLSQVDSLGATLGISKELNELWHLSLTGGGRYTHSRFRPAGVAKLETHDEGGPQGSLALSYAGAKLSGSLALTQDLTAASGRSGATQRTGGNFALSDRFTTRFTGSLEAGYARNWSAQDQFGAGAIDERNGNLSCALRYDFFEVPSDLALEASFTHNTTDYRLLGTRMDQNIVMVRLTWRHASLR